MGAFMRISFLKQISENRRRAFTLSEALVAMGLVAIVVAFAAFAGYRFFKRNAQTAFEIKQLEMVQSAKRRIDTIVGGAVYVSARETTNPKVFGISSGMSNQGSDYAEFIALPPGNQFPVFTITSATTSGECTIVSLKEQGNSNSQSQFFDVDDWMYIAAPTLTDAVRVRQVVDGPLNRYQVCPRIAVNPSPEISPIAVKVSQFRLEVRAVNDTQRLVLSRADRPNQGNRFDEVLIDGVTGFSMRYQLVQKQTRDRSDSCNAPEAQLFHAAEIPSVCNFNNLSRIVFDVGFNFSKDVSAAVVKTESWSDIPPRFDPQNWGNFSNLQLSGPSTACDDRFENQRCLPECAGRYAALNRTYMGGIQRSADFEPGSPYCDCVQATRRTVGGSTVNPLEELAQDKNSWDRCCQYRQELQNRSGQNADPCQFSWCTAVQRADNPYLARCQPDLTCGKNDLSRSCFYPTLPGLQNICNPAGGEATVGGRTINYPDNSDILRNYSSLLSDPNDNFSRPRQTTDAGWAFDSGNSGGGHIISFLDSPACQCFQQLYNNNYTRSFSGSDVNAADWKFDSPPENFSYRANGTPSTSLRNDRSGNAVILPNMTSPNQMLMNVNWNWQGARGYMMCYDPLWNQDQVNGRPNACKFSAHNEDNNGARVNVIDRAAWDAAGNVWGASGGLIPGNQGAPLNSAGQPIGGFNTVDPMAATRNQNMEVRCACDLAGLPHDQGASQNAEFHGFRAGSSPSFANVPGGRCSCYDPGRASHSSVNQAAFPGLPADQIEAAIRTDCGMNGGGGTTGGGGDPGL